MTLSKDAQAAAKNAENVANSVREDADNGLLDEADIAEVETLAQEYYDALDAASDVTSENAATNEQI